MSPCLSPPLYYLHIYVVFLLLWVHLTPAKGQSMLINGQFFTKGLAINDAPAPGSPQHAGSNLVIAVDLSGDGKIDQSAFIPGSGEPTRYDSLEIYLVSSQTGLNFTVSNGTDLLTQEPGSTVKHLNWPLPSCMDAGTYNLTYYEGSHIQNEPFFSITSLIVEVDNPNKNSDISQCDSISNDLQTQPQIDSAPSINPYKDPNSGLATSGDSDSALTITVGSSGMPTQWTIEPSGSIITITDATVPITTATIIVVSTGASKILTTTVTAIMATSDISAGGFFPVNGAQSLTLPSMLVTSLFFFLWLFGLLL